MDQVDIKAEVEAVHHWLGLGRTPPDGLHGPKRGSITRKYTREYAMGGPSLGTAIARTYALDREARVMALLRPQRLDDDLWRKVYALMVTGGPIRLADLVRSLARLTSTQRMPWSLLPGAELPATRIADIEARRLYTRWVATKHRGA